jgi:hypothetical protein
LVLLSFYGQSSIGLTDEQAGVLAEEADHKIVGYWKRCSDLRRAGLIEDIGVRRELSSGSKGMVCVITAAGREVLA